MWMCEVGETATQDLLLFLGCLARLAHCLTAFAPLISALATVAIGFFAWVQWRALSEQSKIGLLNQRMNCYLAYRRVLDAIRGAPEHISIKELLDDLVRCELQSRFLFGEQVSKSFREVSDIYTRLGILNNDQVGNGEMGNFVDGEREIERNKKRTGFLNRINEIFANHERLFSPYLDVTSVASRV